MEVAGAVAFSSSLTLSFLSGPINAALSAGVWNLPWPNLDEVSMNLRLIFSKAIRLVCTSNDWKKWHWWILNEARDLQRLTTPIAYNTFPKWFIENVSRFLTSIGPGRSTRTRSKEQLFKIVLLGSYILQKLNLLKPTFLKVMTLFLGPIQQPLIIMKSLLTSP